MKSHYKNFISFFIWTLFCFQHPAGDEIHTSPEPCKLSPTTCLSWPSHEGKKTNHLSFLQQATASRLCYVLFLSSVRKHAEKQQSLADQMHLVRNLMMWSPGITCSRMLFEFPHLFWARPERQSCGAALSALLNPGQSLTRRNRQNLWKHAKKRERSFPFSFL